jgi:hypothetical protein
MSCSVPSVVRISSRSRKCPKLNSASSSFIC